MHSILRVGSFLLIFTLLSAAHGQNSQRLIDKAHKVAEAGDPYSALDMLEEALEKQPNNLALQYELGHFYKATRDYASARDAYRKVYESRPGEFPLAQLEYGLAVIRTGEYTAANEILADFAKNYRGPNNYQIRSRAKDALEGVELAFKLQEDTSEIRLKHLPAGINSAYTDLSPVWRDSTTLLYAAMRVDSVITYDPTKSKLKTQVKFYEAEKKPNNWTFLGESKLPFNDPKYATGNGAFTADGQTFYFTRCQVEKGKSLCRIFRSEKQKKQWSDPEPLDENINLEGYTSTQPAPAINHKTGRPMLYFVSDRPRGKGGLDIWVSQYDERLDVWRRPSNAGRRVNTEGDEMTPFYVNDEQTLYFSSSGWPSVGGLDVFKVRGYSSRFYSDPENLGFPINSPADDIYFYKVDSLRSGFVVSNRLGTIALKNPTCCDDIWEVKLPEPIRPVLKGTVVSADSGNPAIPDATVALIDITTDDTISVDSAGTRGQFRFALEPGKKYLAIATKPHFLDITSDTISTMGMTTSQEITAPRMKLQPLTKKAIVIKNIYYEFDSIRLTESSKTVLDTTVFKLLSDNPGLRIEILSHTDSKGSHAYNKRLSQGRAQSVVDYLVGSGISRNRLEATGFGEEKPIAPNTMPDGRDNPEGRAKNRRTEFRILDFEREGTEVIYKE